MTTHKDYVHIPIEEFTSNVRKGFKQLNDFYNYQFNENLLQDYGFGNFIVDANGKKADITSAKENLFIGESHETSGRGIVVQAKPSSQNFGKDCMTNGVVTNPNYLMFREKDFSAGLAIHPFSEIIHHYETLQVYKLVLAYLGGLRSNPYGKYDIVYEPTKSFFDPRYFNKMEYVNDKGDRIIRPYVPTQVNSNLSFAVFDYGVKIADIKIWVSQASKLKNIGIEDYNDLRRCANNHLSWNFSRLFLESTNHGACSSTDKYFVNTLGGLASISDHYCIEDSCTFGDSTEGLVEANTFKANQLSRETKGVLDLTSSQIADWEKDNPYETKGNLKYWAEGMPSNLLNFTKFCEETEGYLNAMDEIRKKSLSIAAYSQNVTVPLVNRYVSAAYQFGDLCKNRSLNVLELEDYLKKERRAASCLLNMVQSGLDFWFNPEHARFQLEVTYCYKVNEKSPQNAIRTSNVKRLENMGKYMFNTSHFPSIIYTRNKKINGSEIGESIHKHLHPTKTNYKTIDCLESQLGVSIKDNGKFKHYYQQELVNKIEGTDDSGVSILMQRMNPLGVEPILQDAKKFIYQTNMNNIEGYEDLKDRQIHEFAAKDIHKRGDKYENPPISIEYFMTHVRSAILNLLGLGRSPVHLAEYAYLVKKDYDHHLKHHTYLDMKDYYNKRDLNILPDVDYFTSLDRLLKDTHQDSETVEKVLQLISVYKMSCEFVRKYTKHIVYVIKNASGNFAVTRRIRDKHPSGASTSYVFERFDNLDVIPKDIRDKMAVLDIMRGADNHSLSHEAIGMLYKASSNKRKSEHQPEHFANNVCNDEAYLLIGDNFYDPRKKSQTESS